MFIPDPDLDFLPIPDPESRGQKAPDPGAGSATLICDNVVLYVKETKIIICS
jgi:hypothetical protein